MTTLALIDQVAGWWTELTLARQIFYGIGLTAALVSIVLMVLSVFGMEHDDVVDAMSAGADFDHGGGGIFSIKPLTGFFLGFGWIGGFALDQGYTLIVALLMAIAAGGAIMALIAMMFKAILSMRSDGTARIEDTVGAIGTVYLPLPPTKTSGGQVTVTFRGRQETYGALNNTTVQIPSGEKVKVVAVVDGRTVLVEPLS